MLKATIILVISFLTDFAFSQDIYELKFSNKKQKLHIKTIPFNNVEVIDSRFDTTTIYTSQEGGYPRVYCKFLPSTGIAFRERLLELIAPLQKADTTLLINIKQFRIPNRQYIKRRNAKNKLYMFETRNKLLFIADLYYKRGDDHYQKFTSINQENITLGTDFRKSNILKDIIKASITRQSQSVIGDTGELSSEQISESVKNEWVSDPIMRDTNYGTGLYITFDDFKNDIKSSYPFKLISEQDSIYTFFFDQSIKKPKKLRPYVISDNGQLFIQVFQNKYLKLEKKGASFQFAVPTSLSNMYDLLSMQSINSSHSSYSGTSGNLLFDAAVLTVVSVTDELSRSSRIKKVKRHQDSEQFRQVVIDMYSGDFIF